MSKTTVTSKSGLASTTGPEGSGANRSVFTGAAIGMSWQLAVIVLVPIVGGYKLDQATGRTPLCTLLGLLLAMVGTIVVIRRALTTMNNFQIPEADREDRE